MAKLSLGWRRLDKTSERISRMSVLHTQNTSPSSANLELDQQQMQTATTDRLLQLTPSHRRQDGARRTAPDISDGASCNAGMPCLASWWSLQPSARPADRHSRAAGATISLRAARHSPALVSSPSITSENPPARIWLLRRNGQVFALCDVCRTAFCRRQSRKLRSRWLTCTHRRGRPSANRGDLRPTTTRSGPEPRRWILGVHASLAGYAHRA